ncbi:MAG: hypothetical protein KJ069_05810 [Anaerolineae bacterium]|nr:hypothetical protein [Anaerolineae bacterium]
MTTFGHLLRLYRRQCSDPLRGGALTQSRLGELIGDEIGHAGYSGAAVSDWERDKSKIHADDRLVLVALLAVLHQCGGLHTPTEANAFLAVGNYRALDATESAQIFPDQESGWPGDPVTRPPPITISPGHPVTLSQERRKRLILLDKVAHFWVQGVLETAVKGAIWLDVAREREDTAVAHPWQNVVETAVTPPPNQTILDAFLEADRALLILGAPGSGKTITLIDLARALIARARADETQPLPVILHLASWAEKRDPLEKWIEAELTAKYQIPEALGRQWVEDNDLILLLDGLDEVASRQQVACVRAINHFRQTHGLMGIVVCSRQDEYQALNIPLKLSGAVLLQPLSLAQIEEYLTAVGLPSPESDHALFRELGQSPLMLRLLSETGKSETAVPSPARTDLRSQIFDTYVNQMLTRRGSLTHSPAQTQTWLVWLARQMSVHNQTMFLIEQIQPSWLPTPHHQRLFVLTSRLIDGFSLAFVIWMFWLLVRLTLTGFDTIWSDAVSDALPLPAPTLSLVLFLLLFLLLGLLAGGVDVLFYERRARLGEAYRPRRRDKVWQTAVVALAVSLVSFLTIGLYRIPLVGLASGLFTGFSFALTAHFIHGDSYRNDIRTVEALNWSWHGAVMGLLMGIVAVTLFETVEYQVVGPNPIFRTVFSISLLFTLLGGLRGNRLPTTTMPNQGIWFSAASALAAGGIFAIVMSLVTAVFWSTDFGVLAGILAGWIAAALYGAGTVLNYLWLRLWLTRLGYMPPRMIKFLNETAHHTLLHKVGGGYIFIHRLLQEYFAGLDSPGRK